MTKFVLGLITALSLLAVAVPAATHGGATGIVKERMDAMDAMKDAMKALKGMLIEGRDYDAEAVRGHADTIARHAADIPSLFPKGSLEEPSEALPKVWQSWDEFTALSDDLAVYANALKAAADNPRGELGKGKPEGMANQAKQGQGSAFGSQRRETAPVNDPERLARMPPQAAYNRITQVCRDCHGDYRKKD